MSTLKSITARLQASTAITAADDEYKVYAEKLAKKLKSIFNSADAADGNVRVTTYYDEGDEAYVVAVQDFIAEMSPSFMTQIAKAMDENNMNTMYVGLHKGKPALMFV